MTAEVAETFYSRNNWPTGCRWSCPSNGSSANGSHEFNNEREILYTLFFDMKKDVTELKKMFLEIVQNPALASTQHSAYLNDLKELKPAEMLPAAVHWPAASPW